MHLRTFDPAFCAHFWTDLVIPKFCIIGDYVFNSMAIL